MKSIRDWNQQRDHVTPFTHLKAFAIHPGTPFATKSEFSWLKRASKEVDSTSTIFISWKITLDFHFRFWPHWFIEYFCVARSVSVSEIPFFCILWVGFTSAQAITSSGWMMWQMISQPSWRCQSDSPMISSMTFFCEKVELICSLFSWGLDILGRIKGDFLKTLVASLFFALLLDYVCLLSCLKPEESCPQKDIQIFPLPELNVDAVSTTDFKLGIIISRFQPFVFITWKVNKFSKASFFFWQGLKWRTAFFGCFPSPIICLASPFFEEMRAQPELHLTLLRREQRWSCHMELVDIKRNMMTW